MRRVKIVATLGPASRDEATLERLVRAGMNVARLNLSHGTVEEHREVAERVRRVSRRLGEPVALMVDTPGRGIRLGRLEGERVRLEAGRDVVLTSKAVPGTGDETRLPVDYEDFARSIKPGMEVLLAGGEVRLEAREARPERGEVVCRVLHGGVVGSRQRVSVPEAEFPALGHDDEHARFAAEIGAEYLAASFVRRAQDIQDIRGLLGDPQIEVVAKIETREAVRNLDEILRAADGAMVARGDLGVELPLEEVPLLQKEIVRRCNRLGKPVIIATQMLKSMTESPRPTRAEAADVANAVLDGADALMLSEETAVGRYPVEAVRVMGAIAERAERDPSVYHRYPERHASITEAIGEVACQLAERIGAQAIVPSTTSGSTAKLVAKFRPHAPIVAVTYSERVQNKLALVWGVRPLRVELRAGEPTDEVLRRSLEAAKRALALPEGATVVLTAGVPFGVPGTTNLIRVERL